MRIIFNLINTGLANNGGSFSIIKSANTLESMGHDIKIVDAGRNQNTWQILKVPHVVVKEKQIPDADCIIATGIKSVESTNRSNIKLKFHWIRGWEIWEHSEEKLVKIIKESPTIKIVNSISLQDKLKKFGIESYIIRPGYDPDYFPRNLRGSENFVVGGIYNIGPKRATKRVDWIFKCLEKLKKRFKPKIELYMYGCEGRPDPIPYYRFNACSHDKNYIYNKVDVWLSPSCLEGLHIPPMEAGLTECCVIGVNTELCGTKDYLIDNETGLYSENNLPSFIDTVERALNDKELRLRLGKNLREKIIFLGDRTINMKRLIEFLEKGEYHEQQV